MPLQTGSLIEQFKWAVVPFERRDDAKAWSGGPIYRAVYLFYTRDGQWFHDPNLPGSIDQWAVDRFMSGSLINGAGGAQHLFVMVLDKAGKPMAQKGVLWHRGGPPQAASDWEEQKNTGADGSENIPIYTSYSPENSRGDWFATTIGRADMVAWVGRPYGWRESCFFVLQETTDEPPPPPNPTGDLAELIALQKTANAYLAKICRHFA